MAVGIRLKFDGGTQENYDTAHGVMEIDTDPPKGMIVHSAGPIEGGWGVLDFWESREAFDNFVSERAYATPSEAWRSGVSESARREGVPSAQSSDDVTVAQSRPRFKHREANRDHPGPHLFGWRDLIARAGADKGFAIPLKGGMKTTM